jgi:hypothetical protein
MTFITNLTAAPAALRIAPDCANDGHERGGRTKKKNAKNRKDSSREISPLRTHRVTT